MKPYDFRSQAFSINDGRAWAVSGKNRGNPAGVLEWCSSREDAEAILEKMKPHGQFEELEIKDALEI